MDGLVFARAAQAAESIKRSISGLSAGVVHVWGLPDKWPVLTLTGDFKVIRSSTVLTEVVVGGAFLLSDFGRCSVAVALFATIEACFVFLGGPTVSEVWRRHRGSEVGALRIVCPIPWLR